MFNLTQDKKSKLEYYINNFVNALDNDDKTTMERSLVSSALQAENEGMSSIDLLTAFSKHGIGGEIFKENITNRMVL